MLRKTLWRIRRMKRPFKTDLWSEETIQAMLEGSRSNKHVFLKIATEMEQAEFSKSAEQCASKIKT